MSDKKIGIITVYKNINYGANLQAYALCNYINSLGFDCETVNYTSKHDLKLIRLLPWLKISWDNGEKKSMTRKIKLAVALILSAPQKQKRLSSFRKFWKKYYKLSPFCEGISDIRNQEYDTLVCGSDQVWNPDLRQGLHEIFFGRVDGVKKRIAYAPSIGKEKYEDEDAEIVKKWIKEIDYCSLREASSAEYISNLAGVTTECVCDPVFLLEKEEYEKIAKQIKIKKPYLLVYSVINNPDMISAAKEYAAKKGLTLVEICQNRKRGCGHIQLCAASPQEFLGAIKNAETVITNSFHGTAFSIIFEKDFYVFDNKARGSRITNLLDKAGLENRIIETGVKEITPIDYDKVKVHLEDYIKSSKQFLITAIKSEKKALTHSCIGCGVCKATCKIDAISLIKDSAGFIKSYIDVNKCVNCGMCSNACPTLNVPPKNEPNEVFAFKANDNLRKRSTSGGAAAALAEYIIKLGGCVYGAHMDDDFNLKHIRIDNIDDIVLLQGTKYIQSDMTNVFAMLKKDISNGKPTLFIGTPCQVSAIENFVSSQKLDIQNLYLCDIICHGVPSPKVFKDYILWLGNAEKDRIKKYYFRNKMFSWRGDSSALENNDSLLKHNENSSAFMNIYYSNNITCEACFECEFASIDRVSDVTISDFWGIENENPDFEDNLGVSMVMLNTTKGKELFAQVEGDSVEADINNAKQPQLKHPTKKPDSYCDFWRNYRLQGIKYAIKKYGIPPKTVKTIIYNMIYKK